MFYTLEEYEDLGRRVRDAMLKKDGNLARVLRQSYERMRRLELEEIDKVKATISFEEGFKI